MIQRYLTRPIKKLERGCCVCFVVLFVALMHASSAQEVLQEQLQAEAAYYAGAESYDAGLYDDAIGSWRQAASLCHSGAMVALANLYDTGEGVTPDPEAALSFYQIAAQLGNAVAQMNLGDYFARRLDGNKAKKPDQIQALTWLGLAARSGLTWAERRYEDVWQATPEGARERAIFKINVFEPFKLIRC